LPAVEYREPIEGRAEAQEQREQHAEHEEHAVRIGGAFPAVTVFGGAIRVVRRCYGFLSPRTGGHARRPARECERQGQKEHENWGSAHNDSIPHAGGQARVLFGLEAIAGSVRLEDLPRGARARV
jgi:hypothetical protein